MEQHPQQRGRLRRVSVGCWNASIRSGKCCSNVTRATFGCGRCHPIRRRHLVRRRLGNRLILDRRFCRLHPHLIRRRLGTRLIPNRRFRRLRRHHSVRRRFGTRPIPDRRFCRLRRRHSVRRRFGTRPILDRRFRTLHPHSRRRKNSQRLLGGVEA